MDTQKYNWHIQLQWVSVMENIPINDSGEGKVSKTYDGWGKGEGLNGL